MKPHRRAVRASFKDQSTIVREERSVERRMVRLRKRKDKKMRMLDKRRDFPTEGLGGSAKDVSEEMLRAAGLRSAMDGLRMAARLSMEKTAESAFHMASGRMGTALESWKALIYRDRDALPLAATFLLNTMDERTFDASSALSGAVLIALSKMTSYTRMTAVIAMKFCNNLVMFFPSQVQSTSLRAIVCIFAAAATSRDAWGACAPDAATCAMRMFKKFGWFAEMVRRGNARASDQMRRFVLEARVDRAEGLQQILAMLECVAADLARSWARECTEELHLLVDRMLEVIMSRLGAEARASAASCLWNVVYGCTKERELERLIKRREALLVPSALQIAKMLSLGCCRGSAMRCAASFVAIARSVYANRTLAESVMSAMEESTDSEVLAAGAEYLAELGSDAALDFLRRMHGTCSGTAQRAIAGAISRMGGKH